MKKNIIETQNLEIELLLEGLYREHGYDFRNYNRVHIKRRLEYRMQTAGLKYFSELIPLIMHDKIFFNNLLLDLSINVTEMFRDPDFFKSLRENIVPVLKTYPFIKTWHAGCSSGEEVFSTNIILFEEKILNKAQVYATDFNQNILKMAKEGIYPIDKIQEYELNYQKAGGINRFSDYYTAKYDNIIIDSKIKANTVFAEHNLVTDSVFGEMHLIICRNVLIYFNHKLQNQVIKLFLESLIPGGFLCLGTKETLDYTEFVGQFELIDEKFKIYKKLYA